MKLLHFVLFYILYDITGAKANMDAILNAMKQCNDKFPVSQEEMEKLMHEVHDDVSDNFKCHIKCIMELEETFENGTFVDENFVKEVMEVPLLKDHQADIKTATDECKKQHGLNDCDTAYEIAMCIYGRLPEELATGLLSML
ncbi:general odorant-binding protein 56h [Musca domestica]|uniref:General odorant-binding protein 56h n=1 Tax=Musca domestica TaxID=7370 RepID=A0A1I8MVR8_MUSDO|nr:general odorant-binding protein 56h [Musca domestica]